MIDTIESNGWRIVFSHQWGHWNLTELVNAGKRGKRCAVISIDSGNKRESAGSLHWDLFKPVVDEAPARLLFAALRRGYSVTRSTERGVDVAPANREPVTVSTEKWSAHFSWDSFRLRDETDRHNEPTIIPTRSAATKVSKAYEFAASEGGKVALQMCRTIFDVSKMLEAETGVKTHYYCAMD